MLLSTEEGFSIGADKLRAVEVPGLPRLYVGIVRRLYDAGKIADLKIKTVIHDNVRLSCGKDHARLCLGKVGSWLGLTRVVTLDFIFADFLRDAPDPGKRCDDLYFSKGRSCEQKNHQKQ